MAWLQKCQSLIEDCVVGCTGPLLLLLLLPLRVCGVSAGDAQVRTRRERRPGRLRLLQSLRQAAERGLQPDRAL